MLVALWSAKGGTGTSVVAVALAASLAGEGEVAPGDVVLADLTGDLPDILAVDPGDGPGLWEWLTAPTPPPDATLGRLAVDAGRLRLLRFGGPRAGGPRPLPGGSARARALARALGSLAPVTVVDAGCLPSEARRGLLEAADASVLVLRPCYLGLRRALAGELKPTLAVLVTEPGRSLTAGDVSDVLGVEVIELAFHQAVARATDAGLLASRLPRVLHRPLRRLAADLLAGGVPR